VTGNRKRTLRERPQVKLVQTRILKTTYDGLVVLADREGISLADYIRRLILKAMDNAA